MGTVNPDEFAKQVLYEEDVEMKCTKCGYEETMEHDMLLELAGHLDIPKLYCIKCNKLTFQPKNNIN